MTKSTVRKLRNILRDVASSPLTHYRPGSCALHGLRVSVAKFKLALLETRNRKLKTRFRVLNVVDGDDRHPFIVVVLVANDPSAEHGGRTVRRDVFVIIEEPLLTEGQRLPQRMRRLPLG